MAETALLADRPIWALVRTFWVCNSTIQVIAVPKATLLIANPASGLGDQIDSEPGGITATVATPYIGGRW